MTAGRVAATHVALLRGINLGGSTTVPMKGLVELLAEAGCEDVRTYIQSGNAVFRAAPAVAAALPEAIPPRIAERFGARAPLILRTVAEWRAVVANNPFLAAGADPATLHVMFLADRPAPMRIAALDPERSPPDEFAVIGREVYLRLPNGVGRSKLTNAYVDKTLATTSTARNWRTVTKLLALAEA